PPPLQTAGCVEHLDLGIAGREDLPVRVHRERAQRCRELAGRVALAADDLNLPVFHNVVPLPANVRRCEKMGWQAKAPAPPKRLLTRERSRTPSWSGPARPACRPTMPWGPRPPAPPAPAR